METKTLTLPQTFALLDELVAERGRDYIYRLDKRDERANGNRRSPYWQAISCSYAEEDDDMLSPSCAVGWVLHRIDPELLSEAHAVEMNDRYYDDTDPEAVDGEGYDYDYDEDRLLVPAQADSMLAWMQKRGMVDFDGRGIEVLADFQSAQDRGEPYGQILDDLKAKYL